MVDVSKNVKLNWIGKWIWADYVTPRSQPFDNKPDEYKPIQREDMNKYVLFRHEFEIKDFLKSALIEITADSRYKLFINGKYVGRGINRCEAYYWYYNRYDITEFLIPGKNVIAIHARFLGRELAYYVPPQMPGMNKENSGKGGLLFDVKMNYNDVEESFGSSSETKVFVNDSEVSDVPTKGGLGYVEICDSRKLAKNWNCLNFDDSVWSNATVYSYPINTLILDPNHPLVEKEVFPAKILHIGEFTDSYYDMDEEELEEIDFNIQHILDEPVEPIKDEKVSGKEYLLTGEGCVEILPAEDEHGISILLQFGKEIVGFPRIVFEGSPGTIIDILLCEKLSAGHLAADFVKNKVGSRLILRGDKQFFEQWDWKGFLYLQIKIRNMKGPLKIHKVSANQTHMQVSGFGKFKCSDPKLDELWDACAHTLLCCAIDGYLDCPQREQRSYLGDAYVEAMVANVCFAEPRLTKKLIYDTAFGQRIDGITFSFHPGDYQDTCHILTDYCLYWIQITWDYYLFYGDQQALIDLYPHFVNAIDWFWKYIDAKTSLLKDLPYGYFVDWAYSGVKPGFNAVFNTQFYDCLKIVRKIAELRGDNYIIDKYTSQIDKMKSKLHDSFWDETQGCYRDAYDGEKPFWFLSQHTNSYLSLKGITPDEKLDEIFKRIFVDVPEELENAQINSNRPPKGGYNKMNIDFDEYILYAMPFFMHYVHRFLAKMGRYDIILRYIRKGWLPMIEIGKTGTIWETFNQVQSECHAWSATPAYDLSTYWLGVRPSEPGFKSIVIEPTFYGLNWVDGVYPSCAGDICVSWKKFDNKIEISIQIPSNIEKATFNIPKLEDKVCENYFYNEIEIGNEVAKKNQVITLTCRGNEINKITLQY